MRDNKIKQESRMLSKSFGQEDINMQKFNVEIKSEKSLAIPI